MNFHNKTQKRGVNGVLGGREDGGWLNSFYFREVETWNMLPKNVVEAENINAIKARLDATWSNSPTMFTIERRRNEDDDERFGEGF